MSEAHTTFEKQCDGPIAEKKVFARKLFTDPTELGVAYSTFNSIYVPGTRNVWWCEVFSVLFLAAGLMTMKCANTGRNGPA